MSASCPALLVVDLQNDYFPGGLFPLWDTEGRLDKVKQAIAHAKLRHWPILLIQHVADSRQGLAPFFNPQTPGVEIHSEIRALVPDAPVVIKHFADSFEQTGLAEMLQRLGCDSLILCGMMTQNCITHTALSKQAEPYAISVLPDACTTVSDMLHRIAIHALANRVRLIETDKLGQ